MTDFWAMREGQVLIAGFRVRFSAGDLRRPWRHPTRGAVIYFTGMESADLRASWRDCQRLARLLRRLCNVEIRFAVATWTADRSRVVIVGSEHHPWRESRRPLAGYRVDVERFEWAPCVDAGGARSLLADREPGCDRARWLDLFRVARILARVGPVVITTGDARFLYERTDRNVG